MEQNKTNSENVIILNLKFYPQEFVYEPKWYYCGVTSPQECGNKKQANGGGSNG